MRGSRVARLPAANDEETRTGHAVRDADEDDDVGRWCVRRVVCVGVWCDVCVRAVVAVHGVGGGVPRKRIEVGRSARVVESEA